MGVGKAVDRLFPDRVAQIADWSVHAPPAKLFADYLLLVSLVRRAAIADKASATLLYQRTCLQRRSRDADECVAIRHPAQRVFVEGQCVGVADPVAGEPWQQAETVQQILRRMQPGKRMNAMTRQLLTAAAAATATWRTRPRACRAAPAHEPAQSGEIRQRLSGRHAWKTERIVTDTVTRSGQSKMAATPESGRPYFFVRLEGEACGGLHLPLCARTRDGAVGRGCRR